MKNNGGITLISLVITIVVMLILAGITLNLAIGNNGLVAKSKEIKDNVEQEHDGGQDQLNTINNKEIYVSDGVEIVNDENAPVINNMTLQVSRYSITVNINITETESGIAKIEYSIDDGENYITPDYNQSVTYTFNNLDTVFNIYKIKVKVTDVNNNSSYASKIQMGLQKGDYLNYTYDEAENYILTEEKCGTANNPENGIPQTKGLKWQVLNIDEDTGKIDLVSEAPTDTNVYLNGALGFNNGVYILNDICAKQYSNARLGVKARSINIADMEKNLTEDTVDVNGRITYGGIRAKTTYYESGIEYGTTKTYSSNRAYYPKIYSGQIGAGINTSRITQPDTTQVDPYNESSNVYESPTTETYAQASGGLTVTETYYSIAINSTYYGDAADVLAINKYYWIASRYASFDLRKSIARFGLRVVHNTNYTYGYLMYGSDNGNVDLSAYPLRPVVTVDASLLSGERDENGAWNFK